MRATMGSSSPLPLDLAPPRVAVTSTTHRRPNAPRESHAGGVRPPLVLVLRERERETHGMRERALVVGPMFRKRGRMRCCCAVEREMGY